MLRLLLIVSIAVIGVHGAAGDIEKPRLQSSDYRARAYADACSQFGEDYADYDNYALNITVTNKWVSQHEVGTGRYSSVKFGQHRWKTNRICAIKHLRPIKTRKVRREVKILEALKDGPNIVKLYDVFQNSEAVVHPEYIFTHEWIGKDGVKRSKQKVPLIGEIDDQHSVEYSYNPPKLVFEWVETSPREVLYSSMYDEDLRYYMYQTLKALHYAHTRGIIHRDIKPRNLMIDRQKRTVRLIDWGLSEFYIPGQAYHLRVCSKGYKPPELLLGQSYYDYMLDIWSLGAVFAHMMFYDRDQGKQAFFVSSADPVDQLHAIAKILGTDGMYDYVDKYQLGLVQELYGKTYPKAPWSHFITDANAHRVNRDALDLLDKMLEWDPSDRPTAAEAMAHPYFEQVRKEDQEKEATTQKKKKKQAREEL